MSEELIRVALARHLPGARDEPVRRLRQGGSAFSVGTELVARFGDAGIQSTVLGIVAERSTAPVPRPVVTDFELDVLVYRRLSGAPLGAAELTAQGLALTAFVGRLHSTYVGTVDRVVPHGSPVDVDPPAAADLARERRHRLHPEVTVAVRALLDRALALTPPPAVHDRVLCHLDLRTEHLLVDPATGELAGVVGWGAAAIADPARDLGGVLAHLGRAMFDAVVAGYRGGFDAAACARAEVYARCLLVGEVEHGLLAGDRASAQYALRRLQSLLR